MPKGAIDPRVQPMRNLATDPRATKNATTGLNSFGYISRYTSGSSVSLMTNQTGAPDGITTFIRRTSTAVELKSGRGFDHGFNVELATNPNLHSLVVTAGQYISVAVWVRVIAVDTNLTGMIRGAFFDASGSRMNVIIPAATTLTSGIWSRLTSTFFIPEGAVRFSALTYISSTNASNFAIGDTIDATGLMAVIGKTVPSRHHDGDSFGWKWDGVANASTSVGYPESPLVIRNKIAVPTPISLSSWNTRFSVNNTVSRTIETGGPLDATYQRLTLTANGGTWWRHQLPNITVTPNESITMSVDVRADSATDINIIYRWYNISNAVLFETSNITSITANSWQRIKAAVTCPAAAYVSIEVSRTGGPIGSTLDATRATFSQSDVYCDGNTPGWRWEGTPEASTSVGYPYTLERIAGSTPSYEASNTSSSITVNRPFPSGISGYTVFDYIEGGFANTNVRDSTTTQQFAWLTTAARVQGLNGTVRVLNTGTPSVGRHVGAMTWSADRTKFYANLDASTDAAATSVSPGTQYIPEIYARGTATGGVFVYGALFDGEHDRATRLAINRWLANKYGFKLTN